LTKDSRGGYRDTKIPSDQHLFTTKSFIANDQLFRCLAKLPIDPNDAEFPNLGVVDYSPPVYTPDLTACKVGKLYYENLLMVVGRLHVSLTENLREGPPPNMSPSNRNVQRQEPAKFNLTWKHDRSGGFVFVEKHDENCVVGGSLCLSFTIPVSIISLFMHYGVFVSTRKLSPQFPEQMVKVFTPSYICQPNINHRKITEQAMVESIDLKRDRDGKDIIGSESFMNTGLGYDKSLSFAVEDYTAFGYHVRDAAQAPDALDLESVVSISQNSDLAQPLKATPLQPELLWEMLVELCGIKKDRAAVLPPQLSGQSANPQHLATYYLHLILCMVSEQFNRLENNEDWVSLYTHLVGIAKNRKEEAKNRKEEDWQLYFPKSSSFDDLTPGCYPELRHKVFYLFSLLYPSGKPALVDGVGRVFTVSHSLARVRFPVKEPEYGYMYCGGMSHLDRKPWYPPGGDEYLKVTAAMCKLNLLCMGVNTFHSEFGVLCQEQSQEIQKNHTSHRPQTMNDWLQLIVTNVMVHRSSKTFQRTDKVHSRFIGDYKDDSERNQKLIPHLTIPQGNTHVSIIHGFGKFTPAVTKLNKIPQGISAEVKRLDVWIDNVTEFMECGSSIQRLDKRAVSENESPLPYLDKHPNISIYCPGFTYNEWIGYYAALMARIMTRSYNNKSKYIESCLAQSHKGATVEDVTWAYAVGATNKFMQEFQYKNCLFKPNWQIPYLRLFYLIASCCVHNHIFPELDKEAPEQINAMKMLSQLFSKSGKGSFSPKLAEGCLISEDNYTMAPLKLAPWEERELDQFQVRFLSISNCLLVSKTQGVLLVFFFLCLNYLVYHRQFSPLSS
jgi:hypothetical protein